MCWNACNMFRVNNFRYGMSVNVYWAIYIYIYIHIYITVAITRGMTTIRTIFNFD